MTKVKKPQLVKCGNHYINPRDVSEISKINKRDEGERGPLYVVRFVSNPNPKYACWVNGKDIGILLEQFDIVTEDK